MSAEKLSAEDFVDADGPSVAVRADARDLFVIYVAPLWGPAGPVPEDERVRLAEGIREHVLPMLNKIFDRVRAEEREACAMVADTAARAPTMGDARDIAKRIRARGEP